jgi:hypothetical protein
MVGIDVTSFKGVVAAYSTVIQSLPDFSSDPGKGL